MSRNADWQGAVACDRLGSKAQLEFVCAFHPAASRNQVFCQKIFFDGLRHEEPLGAVTTFDDQKIKLRFVFHSLRHNGQTEGFGQRQDSSNNVLLFLRRFQIDHERSVDLQLIQVEIGKVAET